MSDHKSGICGRTENVWERRNNSWEGRIGGNLGTLFWGDGCSGWVRMKVLHSDLRGGVDDDLRGAGKRDGRPSDEGGC